MRKSRAPSNHSPRRAAAPRIARGRRKRPAPPAADVERRLGQRPLRVGEALRHALAKLLAEGALHDPALEGANITVCEVRVSPDLRNATAFAMPLGGAKAAEAIAALKRSAPYLKGLLGRVVGLRRVPDLAFALDPSFDRAERINTLLARPEVARDLNTADAAAAAGEPSEDAGPAPSASRRAK